MENTHGSNFVAPINSLLIESNIYIQMASSSLFYVFVLTNLLSKGLESFGIEPKCSKFDFEEKLLEKMVRMEHSAELMGDKIDVLDKEFLVVKNDMGKFEHVTNTELERVEGLIEGNYETKVRVCFCLFHGEKISSFSLSTSRIQLILL